MPTGLEAFERASAEVRAPGHIAAAPSSPTAANRAPSSGRFAWIVLAYTVLVIVFGAFVRATNSGDGCGAHWPLCNGEIIPLNPTTERLIEFSHRVSSGIVGLLVFGLFLSVRRAFAAGSAVRKAAFAALVFTFVEALIGAVLVKKGWVGQDASMGRAATMALHLVNTFFLLAALTATAYWASGGKPPKLRGQGAFGWALALGIAGMILLGASGAVTALGDTLFPSRSLAEGLRQDLSPGAHFLIRLRLFHPYIAVSVGLLLVLVSGLATRVRRTDAVLLFSRVVVAAVLIELAAGLLNLWLLAPVWMQLVHLFLADVLWLGFVLLALASLSPSALPIATRARPQAKALEPIAARGMALVKAYVALTKPRVISLLLFTTLAAMVMAQGGWPAWSLMLAVAIGGYMAAGAANAINMVLDRDIDALMRRTARRPTVTHAIPPTNALVFGLLLGGGSFAVLWLAANLLTASLALAGLLFYVFVYTLLLKRRTWHNIVIGGAAGAFPPLVGWAAVANDLSPLAWYLFALIFVWTPVHFWALALLMKDDYASAGVPMLPVVRGERVTVIQIAAYAALTAVVSLLPMQQPGVGALYLFSALGLNVALFALCIALYRNPDRLRALAVFKYSMVYLAVAFLMLAIDRVRLA